MISRALGYLLAISLPAVAIMPAVRADPGMPFTDEPDRIVRDGVFRGKIFIATHAEPEERAAAVYLAEWIHRVTGASPEITTENPGRRERGIYLGATRNARDAGVVAPGTLSREGFAWEPGRRGVFFIVGESPLATRMAVGRFIAERLGVVFLSPGEFGADWVPRRTLDLPEARREFTPGFAWRKFSGLNTPAEQRWALDNGMGELPAMNHALWDVFDAKAFAENPAMFPTLGGRLVAPSGRGGYEPQPNLANPDSAEYAAKRAFEFFQKNPDAPAFSLSINDNMTWDESPESKAALGAGKYFRNRPDYSDYVFGFMNRAAKALRRLSVGSELARVPANPGDERTPAVTRASPLPAEKSLTASAYYHCENTPSFPVEPGVFPVLTADRSEWRDPGFAAEDAALITRWSKSGARHFGIYDYYYGLNMAAPRIFHRAQVASMKHAAKAGASLFYAELEPDWGFDGPKAWLAARLAWDPGADADRALSLYYDSAYGPAARAMRRFYDIAESRWANRTQEPRWIRFFHEESVAELFPSPVCAEMRAALDEAERGFPPVAPEREKDGGREERRRMRVRATSVSFAKVEAFVARYEAVKRLAEAPVAGDAAGAERIRKMVTDCAVADRVHREAAARWNGSALNPGAPYNPDIFRRADPVAIAATKCAGQWRSLGADSGPSPVAAACLAENPPAGVETVVAESFEADSFRPAAPGTWAAAKKLTIPKSPWRTNLFEAARTRFGGSTERAASGKGSLIVAGGDLAKLSRTVPVFSGDTLAARVRHSGKIVPGEHVGLSIRFMDATGGNLAGGSQSVAFPGDDAGWRTLAAVAVAPEGAESAEISLSVMNQTESDALWFDDPVVRRCALGEPLE